MAQRRGLLQNRPALIAAVVFCSVEAVTSWASVARPTPFPRELVYVFGLMVSIFVTASVAFRSPFVGDRIVFGAAATVFVLSSATLLPSHTLSTLRIIKALVSLSWTIAAAATAVLLTRSLQRPSSN